MIPVPSSDGPFNPFGHLDLDLSDSDLRETAYEIFVGACSSRGGGRLLSYVSYSGRISDWAPSWPSFQRSLTFTSDSKVKKSLGINSPKKKKGSGSAPTSPVARKKQHPTIGEVMMVQMKISEETDSRIRPALLEIAGGLVGKRIESVVLPVELLRKFKPSDFETQDEYNEWQMRNLKLLELGLLLHPKIPLDKKDSHGQQLSKMIHNAYKSQMVTGKDSEEVKTLRRVANHLASRTFDSGHSSMCHWADGIPFNLHLYQSLLESIFDIENPTKIITEIDEMLEFMKRTWGILGINQKFHNLCFLWLLFNRFLSTGQTENDLLSGCDYLLLEIKDDLHIDSDFDCDSNTEYLKILKSIMMFMFEWAEKGLFGYREFFYSGNIDLMRIVLSIGLLVGEIVVETFECDDGKRKIVFEASEKVDAYIRSSMHKAFSQSMEKLLTSRNPTKNQQANFNQLPALCVIAQEIADLAFTEKEIYSPILEKYHPLAVGVAVATLHSCFGQEVKAFISGISDLTPDVIQVLIAADKVEMCLVKMAVEASFDSEDGGKAIIKEMSPYETDAVIGGLVKSWIQTRVERLTESVDRNMQKEVWNPKVNKGQFGPSVVEVLKTISDTLEAFFLLPIPLHATLLPDLTNGLDESFQGYIFKAKSNSGTRNYFLPKLPSLTRSKPKGIFESQTAENTTKTDDNDDDDGSHGILQLCVRVNTFIYIRKELEVFEEKVIAQLRSTGEGNIGNDYNITFKLSLTACEDGIQELCEAIGYKLVFHELNDVFWNYLYIDGASSSRIELFLDELELNLQKITGIIQDDSVKTRVVTEIMRASCDGFMLVILAGGQSRNFTLQDFFIIQEDFHLLVDLFWGHGDRLPTELISDYSAPVEGILPLFETDTETLIAQLKALTAGKGGWSLDSGEWGRTDPNTILRVLCHRDDKVAFKFLKSGFKLPKND